MARYEISTPLLDTHNIWVKARYGTRQNKGCTGWISTVACCRPTP